MQLSLTPHQSFRLAMHTVETVQSGISQAIYQVGDLGYSYTDPAKQRARFLTLDMSAIREAVIGAKAVVDMADNVLRRALSAFPAALRQPGRDVRTAFQEATRELNHMLASHTPERAQPHSVQLFAALIDAYEAGMAFRNLVRDGLAPVKPAA